MGRYSTLFAHKVVGVATAEDRDGGARRRELLRSVGVDPDAPIDPKRMIPDTDYYELCERVFAESRVGPELTLRIGASMRSDDYGAFGLAWKSAVDLRGSWERAARYGLVLTSVSTYEVRAEAGKVFMMLHREGERRLGLHLSNEQTFAAIAQISREVSREPFTPDALHLRHEATGEPSAHEAYFGCPVIFGADRDAMEVSEEALRVPNRLGDEAIASFFDTHLEQELSELVDDSGLGQRVRIQVSQSLSGGVPTLSETAGRLNTSARTLQRRLSEQGLSFQTLVDQSRHELAERLLRRTEYSLAEIAFLTGFSEQSAFSRAFKRWSGQAPGAFRRDG